MAEFDTTTGAMPVSPAGEGLRLAREHAGIRLADVAAWTRIKEAHLRAIEQGNFAILPGRFYAVGFARTYAQAIGLDSDAIAGEVREELNRLGRPAARRPKHLEVGDPAKIPSRRLARVAAVLMLAVLVAVAMYGSSYLNPAAELPPVTAAPAPMRAAPVPSPAAQSDPTAESAVTSAATALAQAAEPGPVEARPTVSPDRP